MLRLNGHNPSKRRDDGTEEDHSLGVLLTRWRPELDQILTPAIALETDLLFNAKPGPELRHELAHGQMSAGQCFNHDTVYACWFLFRLCCLPFMGVWDEHVAPFVDREA